MLPYPCHIMISGGTTAFRGRLKQLLKTAESEHHWSTPVVTETNTLDAMEKGIDKNADVVLLDASFVINARKRLAKMWKKMKPHCIFALLFSESEEGTLSKVLSAMGRQNFLPMDVYILKDTYPDELIGRVMTRMVEQKLAEQNLAVV